MGVWSLGQEEPLEKEMATHSSIPAKIISWTEEPGRLWSMGSQTVGHCVTVTKQQQSEQQWLNNSDNTGTHWLIHWWWMTGSGLLPSGTLEPPLPAPSPPPLSTEVRKFPGMWSGWDPSWSVRAICTLNSLVQQWAYGPSQRKAQCSVWLNDWGKRRFFFLDIDGETWPWRLLTHTSLPWLLETDQGGHRRETELPF